MLLSIVQKYQLNTRRVFLVDGLGAVLTTVMLGLIFPIFIEHVGMPEYVLFALASIALTFAIYSLGCFLFKVKKIIPFLAIIITGNATYCLFTTALMVLFSDSLTAIGVLYFIGEVLVIISLLTVEIYVLIDLIKRRK